MNSRLLSGYVFLIVLLLLRFLTVSEPSLPADGDVSFESRLISSPRVTAKQQSFTLTYEGQKVRVVTTPLKAYQYGDVLSVTGKLQTKVLDDGRTISSIYYPEIIPLKQSLSLIGLAGAIRERVARSFSQALPPEEASLLTGMLFGVSEGMGERFKTALQTTGVLHVVAASGMNVTLLAGASLAVLTRFFRRQTAVGLSLFFIAFYVVLAGLQPSIVRAGLMAGIGLTAAVLGRQQTGFISLFLAAWAMLMLDPRTISDIGFQLSFAATAGILFLKPILLSLPGILGRLFGEDFQTTIAAQLATLPILLYYFHSVGILSPLVNVLVLWTVPPVMVLGSIAALAGLIFIPLGSIMSLLSYPFLWYFRTTVEAGAVFMPSLTLPVVPLALIVGYYLLLGAYMFRRGR